jgi:hypothetical protein
VAENADICEEALRAPGVVWEVLPHVVDHSRAGTGVAIRQTLLTPKAAVAEARIPKGNVSVYLSDGVSAGFREATISSNMTSTQPLLPAIYPIQRVLSPGGSMTRITVKERTCTLKVFLPGLKIRLQICTIYHRKRFFGKACFWEADIAIGGIAKRS